MELEEGEIYEGAISLSGGEGPPHRWIVVAPFGKKHIHSIDDPAELHCWPLSVAQRGLEEGRLRYVGQEPGHPVLHLQRLKEAADIPDVHLGLHGEAVEKMLSLLEQAAEQGETHAPYAAAEIKAFIVRSSFPDQEMERLRERVDQLLSLWRSAAPSHVNN